MYARIRIRRYHFSLFLYVYSRRTINSFSPRFQCNSPDVFVRRASSLVDSLWRAPRIRRHDCVTFLEIAESVYYVKEEEEKEQEEKKDKGGGKERRQRQRQEQQATARRETEEGWERKREGGKRKREEGRRKRRNRGRKREGKAEELDN